MASLNMSPPWIIFYRKVETLFSEDEQVRVVYDNDDIAIRLYVEDPVKADALTTLMPTEKDFGNVTLNIEVIPANGIKKISTVGTNLYAELFRGNNAVSYIKEISNVFSNSMVYVVFKKTVVQFYTDDLGDINGYSSTLYQEIAKEIFGNQQGLFFCTDINDRVGSPLGEWP